MRVKLGTKSNPLEGPVRYTSAGYHEEYELWTDIALLEADWKMDVCDISGLDGKITQVSGGVNRTGVQFGFYGPDRLTKLSKGSMTIAGGGVTQTHEIWVRPASAEKIAAVQRLHPNIEVVASVAGTEYGTPSGDGVGKPDAAVELVSQLAKIYGVVK